VTNFIISSSKPRVYDCRLQISNITRMFLYPFFLFFSFSSLLLFVLGFAYFSSITIQMVSSGIGLRNFILNTGLLSFLCFLRGLFCAIYPTLPLV